LKLLTNFFFANVASFAEQKILPSGENAHATQRLSEWWRNFLTTISAAHPKVGYCFHVEEHRSFLPKIFGKVKVTRITGGR